MKIEIGESLIYSFLRHVKKCLITQTNWKPSGHWYASDEVRAKVEHKFKKINNHDAFSDIFKSDLTQTLKQAEIDVLGIDQNDHVHAFEIAFHENGLQYGGKEKTRDRVFKKLLRGYLTLKTYFPGKTYSIAFCSPKVNPATENHILEYIDVLRRDFQEEGVEFFYYSNKSFDSEIAKKTLEKTLTEADGSELFARSIKMLNILNHFDTDFLNNNPVKEPIKIESNEVNESTIENINTGDISIPLSRGETESVQDYVRKIMKLLLENNLLSGEEIEKLQDRDYCRNVFYLQFPLIRRTTEGYQDNNGQNRYWVQVFPGNYYVCSQWWRQHETRYMHRINQWLVRIVG
jgi:hypothetical protein